MTPRSFFARLRHGQSGATIVEFGILAPVLVAMMLGIFQVGIGVQNYNAVRSIAGDMARKAMIQWTNGQPMTNAELQTYGTDLAAAAPYVLKGTPTITVTDVTTPQVTGTYEKTVSITYQVISLAEPFGLKGPMINYNRSIIVTKS